MIGKCYLKSQDNNHAEVFLKNVQFQKSFKQFFFQTVLIYQYYLFNILTYLIGQRNYNWEK